MRPNCLSVSLDIFMLKVAKQTDGCWHWTAAIIKSKGYGRSYWPQSKHGVDYAHRVSWMIHFGEIPTGMLVCHKCDVRKCVNPEHLFLGTAKDNTQDAVKKGRMKIPKATYASDETHQVAKLTNAQVILIRTQDRPTKFWASKFRVTCNCIRRAKNRKTFRDVP